MVRKFIATFAVVTAVLGGGFVAGAQSAGASASGCTKTGYEFICENVQGTGTFVSQVEVNAYGVTICDYQARVIVYRSDGSKYQDSWSPFHSGCSRAGAWFDWYPKRYYPNNSRMCGLWYQSHGVYKGAVCETIHS